MTELNKDEVIEMLQGALAWANKRIAELEHDNEALRSVNAKALADVDELWVIACALYRHATLTCRCAAFPDPQCDAALLTCKRWLP